jgi:hypothetical protein
VLDEGQDRGVVADTVRDEVRLRERRDHAGISATITVTPLDSSETAMAAYVPIRR